MSSTNSCILTNPTQILKQLDPLVTAAHKSWSIGFALFDRRMRYRFVNDALAAMNRLPVKAHVGVPLRAVLADTAAKVEPLFEKVFSTGKPVLENEFSGGFPTRKEEAVWRVSYFPILEAASNVDQVAVIVLDMTILRQLEKQFATLLGLHSLISPSEVEKPKTPGLSVLSAREVQTLKLLANGKNNKQVAAILGISVRTAESHRAKIMLKLRIHSISELVRIAIREELIHI